MDWHCDHQAESACLRSARRVMLAKMDAIGAPSARYIRPTCKQYRQPAPPRDPNQSPQQTPTGSLLKRILAQDYAAARRQQCRQLGHPDRQPIIAEQPLVGQSERQGVASDHRPFYRRVAGARNAPNRT